MTDQRQGFSDGLVACPRMEMARVGPENKKGVLELGLRLGADGWIGMHAYHMYVRVMVRVIGNRAACSRWTGRSTSRRAKQGKCQVF